MLYLFIQENVKPRVAMTKPRVPKTILYNKKISGGISDFKLYYRAIMIKKIAWYLHKTNRLTNETAPKTQT